MNLNTNSNTNNLNNSGREKRCKRNKVGFAYINKKDFNSFIQSFEEKINYSFKNKDLLMESLTDKSFCQSKNYEKLEVIGDAILEVYVLANIFYLTDSDEYSHYKLSPETISKAKHFLVCNNFLAKISVWNKFYEYLITDFKNQSKIDSINDNIDKINFDYKMSTYDFEENEFDKINSDIVEAIIGAIFEDSNIENCFLFLNRLIGNYIFYVIKRIDNIKVSPVNEFCELIDKILHMKTTFM